MTAAVASARLVFLCAVFGALLASALAACAGEAIQPGRAPNHPADPATAEAPYVFSSDALEGGAGTK